MTLRIAGREIRTRAAIPAGHKVAVRAIAAGENDQSATGSSSGARESPIEPGDHVHTHNVVFEELTFDYEFPAMDTADSAAPADAPTFLGYAREDGRAGTRNYIAVVAASNCAAHTAELIAASFDGEPLPENVDGVVAFPHGEGCGHTIGPDTVQLQRTLGGRAGPSQCFRRHHSRPGMRGEPDRSLPGRGSSADQSVDRDDAAIERRHARDGGGGAARNRAHDRARGGGKADARSRLRKSCWG